MATNHTCATCAHDGCCDGLPNCGGRHWVEAVDEDAKDESGAERDCAPDAGPDPYDQWLHDSEAWQESMDRRC